MSAVNWVAGVTFAYFTNRRFVFKSHEPMLQEIPKFVLSRVSTLILDLVVRQVFGMMGINTYITTFVSAVLVFIGNYVMSKLLVFRKGKQQKINIEVNNIVNNIEVNKKISKIKRQRNM